MYGGVILKPPKSADIQVQINDIASKMVHTEHTYPPFYFKLFLDHL